MYQERSAGFIRELEVLELLHLQAFGEKFISSSVHQCDEF